MTGRTLFDKIWQRHVVLERDDGQVLLYADRHLLQDSSAPAFEMLRMRGLKVRRPDLTFATPDHFVPTDSRDIDSMADPEKRAMSRALTADCAEARIPVFDLHDKRQGIVHVVAPEQGLTLPGMVLVCGDSHTSTHGALGAVAFGIGASEVSHVLATQTVWQRKPPAMRITVIGRLARGVTAKDLVLAIIGHIGAAGATGHAVEYAGEAIRGLSMEGRMTVCNMSIEAGAKAGLIAPDETTFAWLRGRPYAPDGARWDSAVARWRELKTDDDAVFAREVTIDASTIGPMVTWGNSPEEVVPVSGAVPQLDSMPPEQRQRVQRSLDYMGLQPGQPLQGVAVDRVFIGSCTNGRIDDLRSAAEVVRGRRVAEGVQAWVVPGSGLVKQQAEDEGLDRVFVQAGFQWRQPGCSMCLCTNGDQAAPGERCASTTNRNFMNRQGTGSRTHLMSPAMAAAAAVTGHITDVRQLMEAA
jgi:3-isopropylmalate/(R)-2-methylmalate dehydratase large subunit